MQCNAWLLMLDNGLKVSYKSQIPVSDSSIQFKKPSFNYSKICTNNYTTKNYDFYNGERIINNYLVAQDSGSISENILWFYIMLVFQGQSIQNDSKWKFIQ